MPCYDKKLEASREDFYNDIYRTRDVDCVISTGMFYLNKSSPFFPSYKELVKRKYEIECHIAAKNNNSKMLEAKWKPVHHYITR